MFKFYLKQNITMEIRLGDQRARFFEHFHVTNLKRKEFTLEFAEIANELKKDKRLKSYSDIVIGIAIKGDVQSDAAAAELKSLLNAGAAKVFYTGGSQIVKEELGIEILDTKSVRIVICDDRLKRDLLLAVRKEEIYPRFLKEHIYLITFELAE